MTDDNNQIMGDIVEQCFQSDNNAEILEIIFTRENDTKVTMKELVITRNCDKIESEFEKITASLSGSSASLSSNAEIITLTNTLRDAPIDAMMLPESAIQSDSDYQAMSEESSIGAYFASSAACADFTVPDYMADAGTTFSGVTSFSNALASYGSPLSSSTCGAQVACSDTVLTSAGRACRAGNNLMARKQTLRSEAIFQCRKFVSDAGIDCDVLNMVETSPGVYSNACLRADLTAMASETYSCDLATFTSLVQGYEQRLQKVFARMDAATEANTEKISTDMRQLVNANFQDKMLAVNAGLTCGFMSEGYRGTIDSLCYAGSSGLNTVGEMYAASASLIMLLCMMMYFIWRINIDNFNLVSENSNVMDADGIVPGK